MIFKPEHSDCKTSVVGDTDRDGNYIFIPAISLDKANLIFADFLSKGVVVGGVDTEASPPRWWGPPDHLESLKSEGKVLWFKFEGMKFRLADKTFYTPDFAVLNSKHELECHEVKGFWQDDARVKIKVVSEMYPINFIAVKADKRGWAYEQF